MSRIVYRIGVDAPTYEADDLSGKGAEITGGRWNEKGAAVVYAVDSRALACLETLVQLAAGGLPLNRYLVEVSIPDPIWAAAQRETVASLPVGWTPNPQAAQASTLARHGCAAGVRPFSSFLPSWWRRSVACWSTRPIPTAPASAR